MAGIAEKLSVEQWQKRLADHRARLGPSAEAYRARRSLGKCHAVEDFLFQYYPFSPSKLLSWHPGVGVSLEIGHEEIPEHFTRKPYRAESGWVAVDQGKIGGPESKRFRFIHGLLSAIDARPPHLGCFGLHEWAMVYQREQSEIRHETLPLRLSPQEIAQFVDSQRVCCTHYDAFRFFTPEAIPLNSHQPSYESRIDLEQPGCIHTNMDLYRWAYKIAPWIPGELLGDCYLYARSAREIDMRASPYDVSGLGLVPIALETTEGREEYRHAQGQLAADGGPLRKRLIAALESLVALSPTTAS